MTSNPQQPRQAAQQPPRFFVAFKFRLHGHTQGDRSGNSRRLNREVMSQREERGLEGVEPGVRGVGFVRHGRRSRVVRCELIFGDDAGNDTQLDAGRIATACVTYFTKGA